MRYLRLYPGRRMGRSAAPKPFDPDPRYTEIGSPDIHWLPGARDKVFADIPLTPKGDLVCKLAPGQHATLTAAHDTRIVEMTVEGGGFTRAYRGVVPRHIRIS